MQSLLFNDLRGGNSMEQAFLMAVFAFSMSASPGPVNVIALSSGLNYGIAGSLRFVGGAAIGFTLLLLLIGLGLQAFADESDLLFDILTVFGVSLILYFGYKLITSDGDFSSSQTNAPSFWQGFILQWLNPKAWGACIASVSLFNLEQSRADLYYFVAQYLVLCFIGVGLWAVGGNQVNRWLDTQVKRRWFNAVLGIVLIGLAALLLYQNFG